MRYPAAKVERSEGVMAPSKPGQVLRDGFMCPLKIDIATLALMTGLPTYRLQQVLSGQTIIGSKVAARLGDALGTGSDYWLNLQASYSEDRQTQRILNGGVSRFLFGSPHARN